jgi:Protein of unknown function (DUF3025)
VKPGVVAAIDWSRPWFAPYRERGEAVTARIGDGLSVAQALNRERMASSPQFTGEAAQGSEAYEAFIARSDCVPTRDNLHDLFNGLVWLRFPALKRRLNALHAAEIQRCGVPAKRGAVRDALTLLDENGALLGAPPHLTDALRRRDWPALFIDERALWHAAQIVIVGHALLEKLVQPRTAMTAHVWLARTPMAAHESTPAPDVDPTAKPFAPLPVLGIPGWWPANTLPDFYVDSAVFRPARTHRSTDNVHPCRS